jgi:hypothetical protein
MEIVPYIIIILIVEQKIYSEYITYERLLFYAYKYTSREVTHFNNFRVLKGQLSLRCVTYRVISHQTLLSVIIQTVKWRFRRRSHELFSKLTRSGRYIIFLYL